MIITIQTSRTTRRVYGREYSVPTTYRTETKSRASRALHTLGRVGVKTLVIGLMLVTALGILGQMTGKQAGPAAPSAYSVKVKHHRAPNRSERQELRDARREAGKNYTCHFEWDGPEYPGYEVICVRRHTHK